MTKPKITEKSLSAVRFDPKNARRHSKRNLDTIENSLREVGAGRSLVAASDGTILAGNATLEAAAQAGFDSILEIETDGTQLVVLRRTDLTAGDDLATKLALYDNRAGELADWQPAAIAEISMTSPELLDAMFTDREIDAILAKMDAEPSENGQASNEPDLAGQFVQFKFGDYSCRVNNAVYERFMALYEREKAEHGYVMLDDVISRLMGIQS
jgi:hypothetical protein